MSHIFISAAHKSSGKTTVALGLCAALKQAGHKVQAFKKGPDYIDPMWLGRAAGRPCYNLDFYTMQHDEIRDTFSRQMQGMDIGIIEGNKGLYDGLALDGSNSNAALASLLGSPVVLVLDSRGMTRGIAPLVLGYQSFDRDISIKGVILNQVGGSRHEGKLRAILEHYTDVKVIGAIHRDQRLIIDERHLGLIPSNEEHLADRKIDAIGEIIREQVDLDQLIEIAASARKLPGIEVDAQATSTSARVKIGIARDAAFGFYYADDLEALEAAGAELVPINLLQDAQLPEIDGLFIGGGFPETHMDSLEKNRSMRMSVRNAIEQGLPVYAECGGLMYLSRKIHWNNRTADMAGVIQGDIQMHERPVGRGYIQLQETPDAPWGGNERPNEVMYGHEFHYSELVNLTENYTYAYKVLRGTGLDGKHDGIIYKNLLANYAHMRDTSRHHWTKRFTDFVYNHKCKNGNHESSIVNY